jgi:hypothetical protein
MIYTIGDTRSYLQYRKMCLQTGDVFMKAAGGSVWKFEANAMSHCRPGYSTFGVDADWEKDTTPSKLGDWNDLLVDAPLIVLWSNLL